MTSNSLYNTTFRTAINSNGNLPQISTQLDSVRSYQFEVKFYNIPATDNTQAANDVTLAAKKVDAFGLEVKDIEVDRVNDKVFYPGKPQQTDLTITFDNLYLKNTSVTLWNWFKTIYDPITGNMTKLSAPGGLGGSFKINRLTVMELDNTKAPIGYVEFYGVYPKKVSFSEKNYSTNEFSTMEVTFKWDFIDYKRSGSGQTGSSLLGKFLRGGNL